MQGGGRAWVVANFSLREEKALIRFNFAMACRRESTNHDLILQWLALIQHGYNITIWLQAYQFFAVLILEK